MARRGTPLIVASGAEGELSRAEIDGDATDFVCVWERRTDDLFSYDEVVARSLTTSAGSLVANAPEVKLAGAFLAGASDPRVVQGPGRSLVTYFTGTEIHAVGINTASAQICESPFWVAFSVATDKGHTLAAGRVPGIETEDQAASVAVKNILNGDMLHGSMLQFVGESGFETNLGGGCGSGGGITVPSKEIAIGNAALEIELFGGDPGATSGFLNLNVGSPLPIVCGPCEITPILALFPTWVSAGASTFELAIPCDPALIDAFVELQWITVTPGTTGCSLVPDLSFSNRLRLQIGP